MAQTMKLMDANVVPSNEDSASQDVLVRYSFSGPSAKSDALAFAAATLRGGLVPLWNGTFAQCVDGGAGCCVNTKSHLPA